MTDDLITRITEVMNLPDASGKGLALTGQGYILLHNIRNDLEQLLAQPAGSGGVLPADLESAVITMESEAEKLKGHGFHAAAEAVYRHAKNIRKIVAAAPASPQGSCNWAFDMDHGWSTDCGRLYCIIEGSPSENDMAFCCFCGKHVTESRKYEADDAPPSSGDGRGVESFTA